MTAFHHGRHGILRHADAAAAAAEAAPGGTPGDDVLQLRGGQHTVLAGEGRDRIAAREIGPSLLDGGAGDDVVRLHSGAPGSTLRGGEGDDRLVVRAPGTLVEGGAGDDLFRLDAATAGGTVILDGEGRNALRIDAGGAPPAFRREAGGGDDLHVILGGGGTAFDPARDVVWKDFFENPLNRVNGLTAETIAAGLAPGPAGPPPAEAPSLAQFMNAANAVYSRDYGRLPADLAPFLVGGEHLALEVTAAGFYGAAFVTPENQLVVSFEGTHISALETQPEFVTAQIAADLQIYLGQVPPAFTIAEAFTEAALLAAAAEGIAPGDVFVTGHSLGAGTAMYVAARLDLAGMTFAAPGIAAAAIPAGGAESKLVNYVEYGDPVGNYSANPPVLGDFLYSPDILRFGEASYIGDPLGGLGLAAAASLFAPGATEAQQAAGLAALAGLAAEYHPLTTYAADLGVTLADPGDPGSAGLLPAILAALATLGLPMGAEGGLLG
jgi:hypothetical protein